MQHHGHSGRCRYPAAEKLGRPAQVKIEATQQRYVYDQTVLLLYCTEYHPQ
jgi:hypothetical protein